MKTAPHGNNITIYTADFFSAPVQALVNPVNCVGVMGKGLALEFRRHFPANAAAYRQACERGEVKPGRLFITSEGGKTIINFPTKRHWRDKSLLSDIELGLAVLADELRQRPLVIILPMLGTGLGGLPPSDVAERILEHLGNLETQVYVHHYRGKS